MKTLHKLGMNVDGVRMVFFATLTEDEFAAVAARGLPPNWFCFHFDLTECDEPQSERVQMIRKLPTIVHKAGGRIVGFANWREEFARAWKIEEAQTEPKGRDGETREEMLGWFRRRGFSTSNLEALAKLNAAELDLLAGGITHYLHCERCQDGDTHGRTTTRVLGADGE